MSENTWFLGIDIGGQSFKMLGCEENIEDHSEFFSSPTLERPFGEVLLDMQLKLNKLQQSGYKGAPKRIGVGFPGIVSPEGQIIECPNIPHWKGENLKSSLEEALGAEVRIENDANCAALAEGHALKDDLSPCTLFLAFGTGLGGGILFDVKVHHGLQGFGGELGHMSIERKGRLCGCGNQGCLEQYFSTNGIVNTAMKTGLFTEPPVVRDLFIDAIAEKQPAQAIVEKAIGHLSVGIANFCKILDPGMIVLGGGLTQERSGEYLVEKLKEILPHNIAFSAYKLPEIRISAYQGRAGVLGTLVLASQG